MPTSCARARIRWKRCAASRTSATPTSGDIGTAETGIVHLVGAGPGAPDLLTLRAARLLGEADIVFHDALIHPETLRLAARALLVPVGKRSGRYSTAQRFINKQLADAARRYRIVVRLKGGDPMLFGRAHEEIAFLKREKIRVEVVPGVTAALAAGAELGISLTQRLVARSVVFATPRTAEGARPSGWEKAIANADTAVLYMAAGEAQEVKDALISAGVRRETPLVIAENVSLPSAAAFAGTLDELPKLAARLKGGPAVIVLGEVCREPAFSALSTVSTLISPKALTAL